MTACGSLLILGRRAHEIVKSEQMKNNPINLNELYKKGIEVMKVEPFNSLDDLIIMANDCKARGATGYTVIQDLFLDVVKDFDPPLEVNRPGIIFYKTKK